MNDAYAYRRPAEHNGEPMQYRPRLLFFPNQTPLRCCHLRHKIRMSEWLHQGSCVIRPIPVHSLVLYTYLCTGYYSPNTSTYMAGTVKEMSLIKQVLQLKQRGESNRGIARQLPINKETVGGYMQTIEANGWKIEDLLQTDDPVLEGMFHAGSPAYTDERMKEFLRLLPYFREQLTNRKLHVTRQLLYDEYRQTHPDGYGKSQFYEHLKQNLVAQKDITTVLAMTYKPGEKLMVDFAGDKMPYIDPDTGEIKKAEVFVACMPYSDYIFVYCVPSQRTEDFLFALRLCLEHLGGVPPIVVPDNLKSAVITPDRHEPDLNKALQDMGNHYGFTVLPCDPGEPTQKALVEDAVRITYNRIARLIKNAGFRQKATIEELEMDTTRGLSTADVTEQATGSYIRDGRFTIVIGPTGTGKTFLINALGERACRQGYKTLYFTMNTLIDQLRLVHLEGRETNFFHKLSAHDLLIIDDFGMVRLEGQIQHDFEQIIDDRYNRRALILASQLPVADWYNVFQSELIAEACLDRLVHKSKRFELKGESLRKKY